MKKEKKVKYLSFLILTVWFEYNGLNQNTKISPGFLKLFKCDYI